MNIRPGQSKNALLGEKRDITNAAPWSLVWEIDRNSDKHGTCINNEAFVLSDIQFFNLRISIFGFEPE
jgi:hypothetical protein